MKQLLPYIDINLLTEKMILQDILLKDLLFHFDSTFPQYTSLKREIIVLV